jgi:lysophospholipid acyltransferase (LPLAT)-like uncharacterized protein
VASIAIIRLQRPHTCPELLCGVITSNIQPWTLYYSFMSEGAKPKKQHRISHYDASLRELSFAMRVRLRLLAGLALTVAHVLGPTLRYEVLGWQHVLRVHTSGRRCVYSFWHRTIFLAMWWWRHRGVVAMSSANFDGQVLGRALAGLGYRTTYGSSSRGGLRGLVELAREMKKGHDAAFAADGPRGPRYVTKSGPPQLARSSGCPIIAFHLHAQFGRTFEKSWDHFQLPRPFSKVILVILPPVEVSSRAGREELASKQAELQEKLERARELAEQWFSMNAAEQDCERARWNA